MNFANILTYFKGPSCAHITYSLGYERVEVCKSEHHAIDLGVCVLVDLARLIGLHVITDTNGRNTLYCFCGSREQFRQTHDFMDLTNQLRQQYMDQEEPLPILSRLISEPAIHNTILQMKRDFIDRIQNYVGEEHAY